MVAGFLPGVTLAHQSSAGGANLFALSRHAGVEIDAERALSLMQFYATEATKAETAPGTLVRSETATDSQENDFNSFSIFIASSRLPARAYLGKHERGFPDKWPRVASQERSQFSVLHGS